MKRAIYFSAMAFVLSAIMTGARSMRAQDGVPDKTHTARMTVTLRVQSDNKRVPDVSLNDVIVKQGKAPLHVTRWTPARTEDAGLELFLLLDDASDPIVGSQYNDIREFITTLPPSTLVGVGYMRNGTVDIVQNFTDDHSMAAKALRLPIANGGVFNSPYLSVMDLIARWPVNTNRREIVMITDGIDRFHGWPHSRGPGFISPDVDSASDTAQRTGTIIDTIFTRGTGRASRNYWEITNGQNSMTMLSEATGGESYYFGQQNAVSFKPYLNDLQKALDNQYLLEFHVPRGKKAMLQSIRLDTPVAGVELDSANAVWVPGR